MKAIKQRKTNAWFYALASCLCIPSFLVTSIATAQDVTGQAATTMPKSNATKSAIQNAAAAASAATTTPSGPASNGPSPGPRGPGPGCNLFPAPANTGTTVGLSYFGPPPSSTNPSLVGPYQLLQSGVVDDQKGTITLPLYKGYLKNGNVPVWYIITDVSDQQVASFLGVNFSTKLAFAGPAARTANFNTNGDLIFNAGKVDFSPDHVLQPGATTPFPPAVSQPGSVGDKNYSPLVRVLNGSGIIYNAPIISFGTTDAEINFPNGNVDYSKVHDQVLAIDTSAQTVTLQLINGFSFGRPLWYISLDSSTTLVAGIEANTYAPMLQNLVTGKDDSFSSGIERIFIAINGAYDCANPQRQGLDAAITDGFRPNNTFGGIPFIANDYSPMWNGQLYQWTDDAVSKGYRSQLREEFQLLTYAQDGLITGPDGAAFGDSQFVINCPPVQRLN